MQVVIIGAGAAGLSCARKLRSSGFDTVILEARERVGGRMWTIATPGGAVEQGAELVHGDPRRIFASALRSPGLPRYEPWMKRHASSLISTANGTRRCSASSNMRSSQCWLTVMSPSR